MQSIQSISQENSINVQSTPDPLMSFSDNGNEEDDNCSKVDLNRTVSTLLRLNLSAMLIISLFVKLTILSVLNGSLNLFLAIKISVHAAALFSFLRNHFLCFQLAFVLDLMLFVVFLLFEFLFLITNFVLNVVHKNEENKRRNHNLGLIGVWLLLLITAIDLMILLMLAAVVSDSRKYLNSRTAREVNHRRVRGEGHLRLRPSGESIRYSKVICKSSSYVLGFICNNAAGLQQLMHPNRRTPFDTLVPLSNMPEIESPDDFHSTRSTNHSSSIETSESIHRDMIIQIPVEEQSTSLEPGLIESQSNLSLVTQQPLQHPYFRFEEIQTQVKCNRDSSGQIDSV